MQLIHIQRLRYNTFNVTWLRQGIRNKLTFNQLTGADSSRFHYIWWYVCCRVGGIHANYICAQQNIPAPIVHHTHIKGIAWDLYNFKKCGWYVYTTYTH
jgi:hypothetical protein